MSAQFRDTWRRQKSRAYELGRNSSSSRIVQLQLGSESRSVYANANLSVYSAQTCNAKCPFCVEELRPASRGRTLDIQKRVEQNDDRYFHALENVLTLVKELNPSISITGGEASKDPRLPRILRTLERHQTRKRTMTTNGSGLLDTREGKAVIEWIAENHIKHLNISRAHYDHDRNARIMRYDEGLSFEHLRDAITFVQQYGTRVRLSCVLQHGEVDSLETIREYIELARALGVQDVIFRQLMKTDPRTVAENYVVLYSDQKRVCLESILDSISAANDFAFQKQILGYYYYVEVWKHQGMNIVFEEADLSHLEDMKRGSNSVIHELVFHPNASLCSTWQPWDDVLTSASHGAQSPESLPSRAA